MTDNDQARATPSADEPGTWPSEDEPDVQAADDPGYLVETGEAAGDDGSVAPIIGGLPAVEGSAWDIGAPLDERGELGEHDGPPDQASREDQRGSE